MFLVFLSTVVKCEHLFYKENFCFFLVSSVGMKLPRSESLNDDETYTNTHGIGKCNYLLCMKTSEEF